MQTFELLTGRWLFNPQAGQTWSVEDDHLAKMVELTGEIFSDKILAKSRKRDEYFDESGWCTFPRDVALFNIFFCSFQESYYVSTNYSLYLLRVQ
jgi:hypothetical protein